MRKFALLAASGLWLAGAAAALAHPATEQFIPIGASPGAGAVQGTAGDVAQPAGAGGDTIVTIVGAAAADGGAPFVIGPNTRIYVDRSAEHKPSTLGTVADLVAGRTVEARLADPETRLAEWIKVRP